MRLRRDPAAPATPPASPPDEPALLAGSVWALAALDGRRLAGSERRTLRFEAERWLFVGPCGGRGGDWRQRGDRIEAAADPATGPPCDAVGARVDTALAALLAARPRFVTGPNGEILIGGGGHWATGEKPRAPLEDDAPLLFGTWRIIAIDGAPPAGGEAPQLAFGLTGYAGGAGCNSMQGHYLAHGRRLFAPPPVRTEMACGPPLDAQEERLARLLAEAPRIALAEGGELALVGTSGSLRLRRQGGAPAWSPAGRLWAGAALRAELTMLGGEPLQAHYSEPATRLRLSARRFDIESGCGRIGGIWRRPSYPEGDDREVRAGPGEIELMTDPEPDPAGACAAPLVRRLAALKRILNGRARILIGAGGELIVAGEEHMLVGRVLR
jgi:heat shock protein HslJ